MRILQKSYINKFSSSRKSKFLVAISFLLANLILRSLKLTENPLGGDEPFTLFHAQMSPSLIFLELTRGNNPPLFELILHYWIIFSDLSLGWTRLLPLLFSALTAFFLYLFVNSIWKGVFPILVSLLYLFSNYHLQFAHEIRAYSLFGLLSVISMWVFIKVWRDNRNVKWWIGLILVNTLLIYTHYFGFFLLFIQTFLVYIEPANRKTVLKKYGLYTLGVCILYLPLIPIVFKNFVLTKGGGTWLAPASSIVDLYNMLWKFSNKPVVTVLCIVILISGLLKFVMQKNKKISPEAKLILTWFLVPFLGMFLISFKVPMYLDRYLIYGSFSYLILVVYTLLYLFQDTKFFYASSGVLILLFATTFSLYVPTERDAPLMVETVRKAQEEDYAVIVCPKSFAPTFTYYYKTEWFQIVDVEPIYKQMIDSLTLEQIYFVWNYGEVKSQPRKWLYLDVASSLIVPDNQIIESLQKGYSLVKKESLDKITTAYYFEAATK